MTNKKFSEDKFFIRCCEEASNLGHGTIKPTTRQASKFRMKKGMAYAARKRVPKQEAK